MCYRTSKLCRHPTLSVREEEQEHTCRLFLWRALLSKPRQVGQGVEEFLIGHGGIRKHTCAGMAFQNRKRAIPVGGQAQLIRISQIDRWRIEFSDKLGCVSCELRSLILLPVGTMAVVANPFPVEDRSTPLGIACRSCTLG